MKKMLGLIGAGVLGVAAVPTAGAAQTPEPGQFAGGFSFQTDDLIAGTDVQILSGYAQAQLQSNGSYRVSVVATDYYQNAQGSRRIYALELCTGQPTGGEMVITCQVVQSTGTNYVPDDFRLTQDAAAPSLWRGTMSSNGTAPVEFIDLD